MTRDALKQKLKSRVLKVTFTKKDTSERTMRCTLMSSELPPLVGSSARRSMEVLPVWDTEKEAWRSFRLDSIIRVEEV